MIRLTNITLTFEDRDSRVTAVDRVSLAAHPGTVTGITGPSGSGKSSLLAVAATLIRPDSGQVLIDDIDATALDPATVGSNAQRPQHGQPSSSMRSAWPTTAANGRTNFQEVSGNA